MPHTPLSPDSEVGTLIHRLGYAGLVPFVVLALLLWIVTPEAHPFVAIALTAYAATITSPLGGIHWGMAVDARNVYVPIHKMPNAQGEDPNQVPGLHAVDYTSGEVRWSFTSVGDCSGDRKARVPTCHANTGLSSPPTVIDGAVFAGSVDGFLRAFDAATGAILWQYDKAPNLLGIMQAKQDWYDAEVAEFWRAWYRDVFDLRTANEFGLAVWGVILNLPLYVDESASPADYPAFGFASYGMNFDNGNFATDVPGANTLTLDQRRIVLRLRYYQLTTRATIPEINRILADVFGPGVCYALDGYNMTMTYVWVVPQPSALLNLLRDFDILPRPAGVSISTTDANLEGFEFANYGYNFDNGNFVGA